MKKVLVTGGAGFIGSHTAVELENASYTPVIIDNFSNSDRSVIDRLGEIMNTTPTLIEGDCSDEALLHRVFQEHGPFDGVIHFAAFKAVGESVRNPLKYYKNNLRSTEVLMQCMIDHGCKNLVFSSSCTVYGQPDALPVTEATPFQPANSPYGYTKQVCERMINEVVAAHKGQFSSILLRYFNPIGAHPSGLIGELPLGRPENLIPYITQTAAGWRDELVVFGDDYDTADGTCVRDFIHVVDLAKAHVAALTYMDLNNLTTEAVNLGTGDGVTVKQVIDTFEEATGMKFNWRMGDRRPGDVEKIYASSTKANDMLNWKTEKSLKDALIDAWNWQQKLPKP
ncbi:MAG: UDP-glucose 4-epimerase GalE [Flavobacteriales bacterium]|nr:UDP-glucose 4-epimerase GalE [Flavobacteriales bacterium]